MIIKPKVRGFICTNAHPLGCAASVSEQIAYVKQQGELTNKPKNVLVIGCSTGYGLASRITSAFAADAATLGICFEKEPTERKTGTAGWYNTAAFHQEAKNAGLYAKTINGDAFSHEIKNQTVDMIKQDFIESGKGKIDLVVYSLASPRRTDPDTGETYISTLKPVGEPVVSKTFDTSKRIVHEISLDTANQDEINNTIKVMGGEDWQIWIKVLNDAELLAESCVTSSYTYIGKELTQPIYGKATIGKAKEDLDRASSELNSDYSNINLKAYVTSLKAVVTQASSAIPVMPLYISLMYQVMKDEGCHEGVIEQIYGLFNTLLLADNPPMDEDKRLRMDDVETNDEIQGKIKAIWPNVTTENFSELGDYQSYNKDFLKLFGFGFDDVDYEADVEQQVAW